ncbi:DUF554 domain-containing protein [Microaerobacter geothermalis]|uniref:DUF554 domain-containing protein n=1 Tax=Microaerobacter geothermalis TaxID=674972 RepID=UPI001F338109|nr:DUF554 domain-containing protein [Microaerobacter geothermalis]MCF6094669.1 DUF554 domain-containing protein [Microaerobacter geothermalis]
MVLLGTIVNALAIIVGAVIGSFFSSVSSNLKRTVMQGIGLSVMILGISMGLKTENILVVILSLVIGGIIGELMKVEKRLDQLGELLEKTIGGKGNKKIVTGFVTATLVYTIGAMAILGALDSGLRENHDILYTKAMLDGFSSIIFSSTLGIGVAFSAIPVFLYQGLIAISATYIEKLISEALLQQMITEITSTGGILIVAIAINLLEIKKINVANLLPSMLIVAILVPLISYLSGIFSGFFQ